MGTDNTTSQDLVIRKALRGKTLSWIKYPSSVCIFLSLYVHFYAKSIQSIHNSWQHLNSFSISVKIMPKVSSDTQGWLSHESLWNKKINMLQYFERIRHMVNVPIPNGKKGVGSEQDQNPAGQTLFPVASCSVPRRDCAETRVRVLPTTTPRTFPRTLRTAFLISCALLQQIFHISGISSFLRLPPLSELHIPIFQGLLPWPPRPWLHSE